MRELPIERFGLEKHQKLISQFYHQIQSMELVLEDAVRHGFIKRWGFKWRLRKTKKLRNKLNYLRLEGDGKKDLFKRSPLFDISFYEAEDKKEIHLLLNTLTERIESIEQSIFYLEKIARPLEDKPFPFLSLFSQNKILSWIHQRLKKLNFKVQTLDTQMQSGEKALNGLWGLLGIHDIKGKISSASFKTQKSFLKFLELQKNIGQLKSEIYDSQKRILDMNRRVEDSKNFIQMDLPHIHPPTPLLVELTKENFKKDLQHLRKWHHAN